MPALAIRGTVMAITCALCTILSLVVDDANAQAVCADGSPEYFGQCGNQRPSDIVEVKHRIRQVDTAIAVASNLEKRLEGNINSGTGEDARNFGDDVGIVAASVRLTGIVGLPAGPDSNRTVWLGYSGFGVRHLVDQSGYKLNDYASSSITDILPGKEVGMTSQKLESILATFPEDALKQLTNAHVTPRAAPYQAQISALSAWLRTFSAAWLAGEQTLNQSLGGQQAPKH